MMSKDYNATVILEQDETIIKVENVTKIYGRNIKSAKKMLENNEGKGVIFKKTGSTVALNNVSFDVKKREILCIIGLSGSGKSTIIRCLNLLLRQTSGSIVVNGIDIASLNKKELLTFRRNQMSMVFQNFGLMDHRNVLDNVAYPLEVKGMAKEKREQKAKVMIKMVGLSGLEETSIHSLSGGMKQRVGIARALTSEADILLMDEPFSALDPLVRKDMQFELLKIQKNLGKTIIFVTHDIDEAFKLGDRVAIMKDGELIQIDTPEVMFDQPANEYVKSFIDDANRIKVFTAGHVMIAPSCLIKERVSAIVAINEMKENRVSSAYVVDEKMKFKGVVTIDSAFDAKQNNLPLIDKTDSTLSTVHVDTTIADLMNVVLESAYPVAVVDDELMLQGIITKSSILALLS